jgi:DNA-binding transcriptional LysR family regulator
VTATASTFEFRSAFSWWQYGAPRIKAGRKTMELRHRRYFVQVAKELHFTRAGKWLAIKKPPLSLHIRPARAGNEHAALPSRDARREAHRICLVDEARRILDQVKRTKAVAKTRARGETGHIHLGFAGTIYVRSG